jgi:RimJ/RimL family protein N-acetyltransferase
MGEHEEQVPREADPETGLPLGPVVTPPGPARQPARTVLEGRDCRLEPVDPARHRDSLFAASTPPDAARRFRYLPDPPPESPADIERWLEKAAAGDDPLVFAVIDRATGRAEGRQQYMRIAPEDRSVEIGNIYWGPAIARTPVATEANYLFAVHAFEELGYRRYEWKCDALNAPSRRAAERFGFTFEGHFRRDKINRGRSRDTVWFAMIDEEWPALKRAYERWLDPANFDADGRQKQPLRVLTAAALGRASENAS